LISEYFTHRRSAGTLWWQALRWIFLSLAWLKIKKFTLQQLFTKLASMITVGFEELIVVRLVKNFSAY
jgi:hypothetical protein